MARGTWPADPDSSIVGQGIDWRSAPPLALRAGKGVWKRVDRRDAMRLRDDPAYKLIFKTLDADTQCIIHEICDKDPEAAAKGEQAVGKEKWLKDVDAAAKEAEDDDNVMAKLRALELRGKAIGVFEVQTQKEDTALAQRLAAARRRLSGSPG